jgi:hypothetical protein
MKYNSGELYLDSLSVANEIGVYFEWGMPLVIGA